MYQVIAKKTIQQAAAYMQNQPNNAYHYLLQQAHSFELCDLTPIFLRNLDTDELIVTSKQKIEGNYH